MDFFSGSDQVSGLLQMEFSAPGVITFRQKVFYLAQIGLLLNGKFFFVGFGSGYGFQFDFSGSGKYVSKLFVFLVTGYGLIDFFFLNLLLSGLEWVFV